MNQSGNKQMVTANDESWLDTQPSKDASLELQWSLDHGMQGHTLSLDDSQMLYSPLGDPLQSCVDLQLSSQTMDEPCMLQLGSEHLMSTPASNDVAFRNPSIQICSHLSHSQHNAQLSSCMNALPDMPELMGWLP